MKTDDQPSHQARIQDADAPYVHPAEVVRSGTAIDAVLWLVALAALISATLVNQYLPAYWAPASNVWVRVGFITGLIVGALGLLIATHQGKGFITLLKDSRVELRRISWPAKQDTFQTTWIVLVVVLVMSLLLWGIDTVFGLLISSIIG
jgi:preprotein translocase subunit SecE